MVFSVGVLSGCEEGTEDATDMSVFTMIEALAQVINGTGEPVAGASVTFDFRITGNKKNTIVRTTDSTGWTDFAVESLKIPDQGYGYCDVYLTNDNSIREEYSQSADLARYAIVNEVSYWSISARLVQD